VIGVGWHPMLAAGAADPVVPVGHRLAGQERDAAGSASADQSWSVSASGTPVLRVVGKGRRGRVVPLPPSGYGRLTA
jgi:hypothetical protein